MDPLVPPTDAGAALIGTLEKPDRKPTAVPDGLNAGPEVAALGVAEPGVAFPAVALPGAAVLVGAPPPLLLAAPNDCECRRAGKATKSAPDKKYRTVFIVTILLLD